MLIVGREYVHSSFSNEQYTVVYSDEEGALVRRGDGTRFHASSKNLGFYKLLPRKVKRVGFIGVGPWMKSEGLIAHCTHVFATGADAKNAWALSSNLKVVRIEWEEEE